LAALGTTGAGAAWALAAAGLTIAVATVVGLLRQRAVLIRLDERMTHLTAAVSLLTNTTEEGWRSAVAELARSGEAAPAAVPPHAAVPAPAPESRRARIARAAGHGRSVQDIAAAEQMSEGEVLLHLLLEKIQPEGSHAEMC
jgi:DNA-binding NarL/FixJ family response regulator